MLDMIRTTNRILPKAALQIKDLILNTPELRARLQKSAKSNALSEFEFTFNECVQDALVGAYDQNVDFSRFF